MGKPIPAWNRPCAGEKDAPRDLIESACNELARAALCSSGQKGWEYVERANALISRAMVQQIGEPMFTPPQMQDVSGPMGI